VDIIEQMEMNRAEDLYELGLEKGAFTEQEYKEEVKAIESYYDNKVLCFGEG